MRWYAGITKKQLFYLIKCPEAMDRRRFKLNLQRRSDEWTFQGIPAGTNKKLFINMYDNY